MAVYWRLQSIPELQDLSAAERRMVWRACAWNVFRHWQVWAALGVCGLIPAIGGSLIFNLPTWFGFRTLPIWWHTTSFTIAAALGGAFFGQIATYYSRRYLRAFRAYHQLTGVWAADGLWVDLVE
jgi:hypothetical protein